MNNKRLRIIMDEKKEIMPDWVNNYVVGAWDNSLDEAIDNAIQAHRTILVIRPEGINLRVDQL